MPDHEQIDQQLQLLDTYRHRLAYHLRQQALGGLAVRFSLTEEVRQARAEIGRIKKILRDWEVDVKDHPDDDEPPTIEISPPKPVSLSTLIDELNSSAGRYSVPQRGQNPATHKPSSQKPVERNTIFISYSRADKKWLDDLHIHLKPLERDNTIVRWDDTMIKPGSKWRNEIDKALKAAKVAILLISANFLASDFIADNELPPLLKAAEEEGAIILPVIVGHCLFARTKSISQFQAVNPPSQPLSAMPKPRRSALLVKVAEAVEDALKQSNQLINRAELNDDEEPTQKTTTEQTPKKQIDSAVLRQILVTRFSEGELRDLCFDLHIDYESLEGQGKSNKARELIDYVLRHGRINELVRYCPRLRPDIDWQSVYQAASSERLQESKTAKPILLEQTQKELLISLVEAARNVPQNQPQKFTATFHSGDDTAITILRHAGFANRSGIVQAGDIDILAHNGLILGERKQSGTFAFDITPEGFAYYETFLQSKSEDKVLTIEEAKYMILEALSRLREPTSADFIDDTEIAEETKIAIQDVRDYLDILEGEKLTRSANSFDGYAARICNQGRIVLREWKQAQPTSASPVSQQHTLIKLSEDQHRRLAEALIKAFSSHGVFSRMLRYGMNVDLAKISPSTGLADAVYATVAWADAQGRLEELIKVAHGKRPDVVELNDVARELLLKGT